MNTASINEKFHSSVPIQRLMEMWGKLNSGHNCNTSGFRVTFYLVLSQCRVMAGMRKSQTIVEEFSA